MKRLIKSTWGGGGGGGGVVLLIRVDLKSFHKSNIQIKRAEFGRFA